MKILILVGLLLPAPALAQGAPGTFRGSGSMAVTTSSAPINTMTLNARAALPVAWSELTVYNPSAAGNVAVCPLGGTCTCPQSSVDATNGDTVLASGGSWTYSFPVALALATPTIVACSSTATVEFAW